MRVLIYELLVKQMDLWRRLSLTGSEFILSMLGPSLPLIDWLTDWSIE